MRLATTAIGPARFGRRSRLALFALLGLACCDAEPGPSPGAPDGGGGSGDPPGVLTVGFAAGESTAWEGTGSWPIELSASEAVPRDVTVRVTIAGGDAAGSDATLAAVAVTLKTGERAARVIVTISDDDAEEMPETLRLQLTAQGAETGRRGAHTMTLLDDDARGWPGDSAVTAADTANRFGANLSGLTYEAASGGQPARMWAVKNGPSLLYRLEQQSGRWEPSTTDGWANGKTLRYPGGAGAPDSEGVTRAGSGAALYVAAERAEQGSRLSVLRYDPSGAATSLSATHEWNLTTDLPSVDPNAGFEAITWIPDALLVARGFRDDKRGKPYAPADYPGHGDGLFALGLEGNGMIYLYALDHGAAGGFARVASFASGHASVMALEQDGALLWAGCDDTCDGELTVLTVDDNPLSATHGRFVMRRRLARPGAMPNLNNEGIAIAPDSECVNQRKPFFWTDDGGTGGTALRQGSVACGAF